tara:strand:+ start:136 stop:303 length:168 start_codon:yes stop_codon:yes gene_type:complete
MCNICHGTAMISRPRREITGNQIDDKTKLIIIGGIDACWKCAEKAEAEFQGVKDV